MKGDTEKISIDNIRVITRSGLLIALSAIGAMIKIQGTIAFDSMPGYFAALFISPMAGGFVAALGHLLTSITSGFPLTVPMHLIVALEMGLFAYIFGILGRKGNGVIASIVAILLNGPIATFVASITAKMLGLPFNGPAMFNALVIPLTIASSANIILAYVIFKIINKQKR
ncbi:ECF transporter S component [Alkaliphilus sp. B6464]|uniref:ECF transporter S component n=1 Tax=Alkaliphilus sp. B6464 TaxID=2731219 RepID=UPI001BA7F0D9|nr:ECF transporter S component [Alkaliphilus sp. B6464]QUH19998.1 ECF transporter S component [Alkaliphilus sp. B6464]